MLGEIDCREGLLLAVDKLKYDTMEQAMAVLIGLYVRVLLGLIAQRRFEVFVHPVPPVLDETRHVVQPFNRALQREVGLGFGMQNICQLDATVLACGAAVRPRAAARGGCRFRVRDFCQLCTKVLQRGVLWGLCHAGQSLAWGCSQSSCCSAALMAHLLRVACVYHSAFQHVLRRH